MNVKSHYRKKISPPTAEYAWLGTESNVQMVLEHTTGCIHIFYKSSFVW